MIHPTLQTKISFDYQQPTQEQLSQLQILHKPFACYQLGSVRELHTYRQLGYAGTLDNMILREGVAQCLNQAIKTLPHSFEFWIYDAFRTRKTQLSLFEHFYSLNAERHPDLNAPELYELTKKFVAHPNETSRFAIPPHNSGGAIDLVIACDGQALDMGTEFDADTVASSTDYFEGPYQESSGMSIHRWLDIRKNRRLLFNTMKLAGFVNYQPEWWHYDLGDCIWAQTLGIDWFYDSLEEQNSLEIHL